MRLELNLASRPLVNHVPHVLLLGVLGLIAFVLTAWNSSLYWSTWSQSRVVAAQVEELREQEEELLGKRQALLKRQARMNLERLEERAIAHNAVLSRKSLNWHLMLLRLQELQHWRVRLEGIKPAPKDDFVALNLDVAAKKQEHMLEYIKVLELSPCFSDVYPDYEEVNDRNEYASSLKLVYDPWCGTPHVSTKDAERRARSRLAKRGRNRG